MTIRFGFLVFDDAEELDFVGPWEVFTMGNQIEAGVHETILIAEHDRPVRCRKGMRVLPDFTTANAQIDVLLIPGGQGTRREVENKPLLEWIARTAATCQWVTSVCTERACSSPPRALRGQRVQRIGVLSKGCAPAAGGGVLEHVRYVRDGNVVTAAGVSAGIDMALALKPAAFAAIRSPRPARHGVRPAPRTPQRFDCRPFFCLNDYALIPKMTVGVQGEGNFQ